MAPQASPGQEQAGYYSQPPTDVKYAHLSQGSEYPGGIAGGATPTPPYMQPHYENGAAGLGQSSPTAVEADSISVPPPDQRVYEIGEGEAKK